MKGIILIGLLTTIVTFGLFLVYMASKVTEREIEEDTITKKQHFKKHHDKN